MAAYDLAECLVGFLAVSQLALYLSHEKPLPGSLYAAPLVADHFPQIGDSLIVFSLTDIVVGIGVVPVLHGTVVHRVTAHVAYHVLGIIQPAQFCVALCQPCSRHSVLHRLGLI